MSLSLFYVVDIDECESNPCENGGTCADAVNGYSCECAPGFTDANCKTGTYEHLHRYEGLIFFKEVRQAKTILKILIIMVVGNVYVLFNYRVSHKSF